MQGSGKGRLQMLVQNALYLQCFAYVRGVIDTAEKNNPQPTAQVFGSSEGIVSDAVRAYVVLMVCDENDPEFEDTFQRFRRQYYYQLNEFFRHERPGNNSAR